jgi:hypothetical protein
MLLLLNSHVYNLNSYEYLVCVICLCRDSLDVWLGFVAGTILLRRMDVKIRIFLLNVIMFSWTNVCLYFYV